MSVVARKIAATPKRTAAETWKVIIEMIADRSSQAWNELNAAAGIAAAIIAEEIPQQAPFIITGDGPRVRIYCEFGENAVLGDDCNEDPLLQKPISQDWHLYIPCAEDELSWTSAALKDISSSIIAYDKDKDPDIKKQDAEPQKLTINTNDFLKKL